LEAAHRIRWSKGLAAAGFRHEQHFASPIAGWYGENGIKCRYGVLRSGNGDWGPCHGISNREQVGGMMREIAQVSIVLLTNAGQIADNETAQSQALAV
jgi:hypothetical protein